MLVIFQVAHFHNTISQQMIPSQQPMMLEAAMAFEHIIKNPKAGVRNTGSEVKIIVCCLYNISRSVSIHMSVQCLFVYTHFCLYIICLSVHMSVCLYNVCLAVFA